MKYKVVTAFDETFLQHSTINLLNEFKPWFKEWNVKRPIDGRYASEWNADYSFLAMRDNIDEI